MGKQASVVLSDGVPLVYSPLPFADSVLRDMGQAPEAEAVIILECDSVQRTRLTGLDRHFLINIDHHATARPFADVNWIDSAACATAISPAGEIASSAVSVSPRLRVPP